MPRTGMTAEELKDKAVETAVLLVRRHGFEKLRLVDVAKELGVSHAALYPYFDDRAALVDAISERWLDGIDETLDAICRTAADPAKNIRDWMLGLHRAKREKVRADPAVYHAFNAAANQKRPFTVKHLANSRRQLIELSRAWIAKYGQTDADSELMATTLQTATLAFHHPSQVAEHMDEDREPLLLHTIDLLLSGMARGDRW